MANLVPCFYTTVKNVSTQDRVYGFLGTHGKRLTAGSEYTEFGDLVNKLSNNGAKNKTRHQNALMRALAGFTRDDGRVVAASLKIKSSPAVILYDTDAEVPKTFTLATGTLGVADPCYGSGY